MRRWVRAAIRPGDTGGRGPAVGGSWLAVRPSCFLKQKTAYELTYGDWSSDVCSSDLSSSLAVPDTGISHPLAAHRRDGSSRGWPTGLQAPGSSRNQIPDGGARLQGSPLEVRYRERDA